MKSIWKFPMRIESHQSISMPKDAVILSVQDQFGEVMMWAIVDTEASNEDRVFFIYGTGHKYPDTPKLKLTYITTFQQDGGNYVWHVFEHKTNL